MKKKYVMHTAESNEKKPNKPEIQTAVKNDVKEALEILLEGSTKKNKSLPEQAKAFRKRIDEMEEANERDATHA